MITQQPRNIAIQGAGIMGLTVAYTLERRGHTITLYDPAGFPNTTSASYIAGGMLAPYSEIDLMTPEFIKAGLQSIALWTEIASALDINLQTNGSILVAHNEDAHMLKRFEHHLPDNAFSIIAPQDKEPYLPSRFNRALYLPQEAAIHPQQAMQALCAHLQAQPTVTLENNTLTNPAPFDTIIDCTGSASNDPDLRGVKGEIAIVENTEITLSHTIRMMHPRYPLYIVPRPNNLFMIGATQIESSADTSVSVRSGLELLSALYSLHPTFGEARIHALQAGIRPAYPDNLPRVKQKGNIISANGLFRHGYLLSPVIARDIADMLENQHSTSLFLQEAA